MSVPTPAPVPGPPRLGRAGRRSETRSTSSPFHRLPWPRMPVMKEVLAYDTVTEAEFAAGLLQVAGIPCEVRNEATSFTGGVGTMLPFPPQIWVLRDEDLPAALDILRTHPRSGGPGWKCQNCGTANEVGFDACWSCGADRSSPR